MLSYEIYKYLNILVLIHKTLYMLSKKVIFIFSQAAIHQQDCDKNEIVERVLHICDQVLRRKTDLSYTHFTINIPLGATMNLFCFLPHKKLIFKVDRISESSVGQMYQ